MCGVEDLNDARHLETPNSFRCSAYKLRFPLFRRVCSKHGHRDKQAPYQRQSDGHRSNLADVSSKMPANAFMCRFNTCGARITVSGIVTVLEQLRNYAIASIDN